MANKSQAERLAALEHSHRDFHAKLDQLLGQREPFSSITLDASGQPVVMTQEAPAPTGDNTVDMMRVLLPLMRPTTPPPAPTTDWVPILVAVLPILLDRLLTRPDPVEQIERLQNIAQDGEPDAMTQMMMMAMPAVLAKFNKDGGAGDGDDDEALKAEAIREALQSVDPAIVRRFLGGQAAANGTDS